MPAGPAPRPRRVLPDRVVQPQGVPQLVGQRRRATCANHGGPVPHRVRSREPPTTVVTAHIRPAARPLARRTAPEQNGQVRTVPPHLAVHRRGIDACPRVFLVEVDRRRAHRAKPQREPAVLENDVGQRHQVLDARRRIAVREVRVPLAVECKQIDRAGAGRGLRIQRIRPLGALIDVAHAVAVGILKVIQIADIERLGQIDGRLHSNHVLSRPFLADLLFEE